MTSLEEMRCELRQKYEKLKRGNPSPHISTSLREQMTEEKPSPCECIKRLRNFKNRALGDFWQRVRIPEPGILGIFGVEVPEKEDIQDALEDLKGSLEKYTKECPWKITPEARELAEALDKVIADEATLEAVMSGQYEWTFGDLIEKAEVFTGSAVDGLHEATEGPKPWKGPTSPDLHTRHECTALLNNVEAAKKEIQDKAEEAEGYMTAPEELVNEMDNMNETQRDLYKDYLHRCKMDPLNVESELETWARQKEDNKATLERYDQWTREHEEELRMDPEKWRNRVSGRDHWVWEIEKDISTHQNPVNVFIEDEWSNACQNLKWEEKK